MKHFRQEFIWIVIFFIIIASFFYPTILRGKIPVPADALVGLYHPWRDLYRNQYPQGIPFKNFLITDPVRQQIPWRKVSVDQWKEGKLPRWNPFSFAGAPLDANIQAAVFYPLNILFLVFSFPVAWTILIMLEPILAGLFFYFYVRHLKISPWAGLLGAIVWSLGGFSVAWLTWGTMIHVSAWLPLVLLSVDELLESRKGRFRWGITLLLALIMSFFAGHTQIFLYILLLSTVYGTWKLMFVSPLSRKSFIIDALWVCGVFVVLSAVQWIPLANSLFQSSRFSDLTSSRELGWFLPWQHLVQFIAPDFFGNPTTLNYWGIWNYGEFTGYIGILGLLFAAYATTLKERNARFWLLVFLVTLVFLLPNPLSNSIYQLHIPVLSALQPTRLMVIVDFALAVLVSLGADKFMKDPKRLHAGILGIFVTLITLLWLIVLFFLKSRPNQELVSHFLVAKNNLVLPSVLLIVCIFLLLFWQRMKNVKKFAIFFQIASIILLAFDLLRFGWKFTPFTPVSYFFPQTQTLTFLQKQPKPFRIAVLDSRILPPNTSLYYGLESIEGYDPIYYEAYEEFAAASERGRADITPPYGFHRIITPHNIDSPLLPLLNVRYVLSLEDLKKPYLIKVFQEGQTKVYQDTRSLPRAYFVQQVSFEKDKRMLLEHLFENSFQPRKEAFVDHPLSLMAVPLLSSEFVQIKSYDAGEISLDVQTLNDRLLVIANVFYPGWQAHIDGKQVQIYRTDYLFQGIIVPPGRHAIVLRYRG